MCVISSVVFLYQLIILHMIERLGNISLICMVLFATTGFVVNKHYTNGELFSASLYSNPDTCCVEDDFCACCSEESQLMRIDHSFLSSKEKKLESLYQPAQPILYNNTIEDFRSLTKAFHPVFEPPYPRAAIQKWLQIFLL